MAGETLHERQDLPEYDAHVDENTVKSLLDEVAKAAREMSNSIHIIEMAGGGSQSASGGSAPLSGEFVEGIMQGPMRAKDRASGLVHALDALAPLRDGSSWEKVAEQIATTPPDNP